MEPNGHLKLILEQQSLIRKMRFYTKPSENSEGIRFESMSSVPPLKGKAEK